MSLPNTRIEIHTHTLLEEKVNKLDRIEKHGHTKKNELKRKNKHYKDVCMFTERTIPPCAVQFSRTLEQKCGHSCSETEPLHPPPVFAIQSGMAVKSIG